MWGQSCQSWVGNNRIWVSRDGTLCMECWEGLLPALSSWCGSLEWAIGWRASMRGIHIPRKHGAVQGWLQLGSSAWETHSGLISNQNHFIWNIQIHTGSKKLGPKVFRSVTITAFLPSAHQHCAWDSSLYYRVKESIILAFINMLPFSA